jgi:hypothetical protein
MTLVGLPETVKRLQALPDKIQKRAMSKAIRAGGNVFVKAAKRNAPRATGLFKRSLDQKVKSYRGGAVTISIVGQKSEVKSRRKLRKGRGGISGRGQLVPIHFIEEDTRPHRIPKEFRKTQIKTTKEHRDRMRALGLEFRKWKVERRGPLVLRLPSGQQVIVDSIEHPGTRGTHPIRRAAESSYAAAGEAFAAKLRIETDAEVAKLASSIK